LLSPEDTQLFYQIALVGRRDLPLAPDARGGFEMVLLRMLAFRPAAGPAPDEDAAPARSRPAPPNRPERAPASTSAPAPETAASPTAPAQAPPAAGDTSWAGLIEILGLKGVARELAANCALLEHEDDRIRLALDPACRQLHSATLEKRIQDALSRHYGRPVRLVLEVAESAAASALTPAQAQAREVQARQEAAVTAIENDANVKALRETFDARVQPDSIRPLD
ncbi:MAG TPA: DNA polymerase III subunit gamma/tau C-terminal domain-containing protein, partial [Gammaproteobacteria bacterium]|nr:DNA polymerase III subunit gamma/tau C-terminal domain-containing protein [Gammaproteobacteria bacterium]